MFATCQVFELLPGIESQEAWQEAALLCHCAHDRIVPLYGVALTVRKPTGLTQLHWELALMTLAGSTCKVVLAYMTWRSRPWMHAGPAADADDEAHARRQLASSDAKPRVTPAAVLGKAVRCDPPACGVASLHAA
jgi:hypothetical protein